MYPQKRKDAFFFKTNKTAGLALPTVLLWKLEMMKSLAVNIK